MRKRDEASLRRRLEVLRLPVASLQRHGFVMPSDPAATLREPEAVGLGPDGTAFAVWQYCEAVSRRQMTWHVGGRRRVVGAVDVQTDLRVRFVQPLPEGRVLLTAARRARSHSRAEAERRPDPTEQSAARTAVDRSAQIGEVFEVGRGAPQPGVRASSRSVRRALASWVAAANRGRRDHAFAGLRLLPV